MFHADGRYIVAAPTEPTAWLVRPPTRGLMIRHVEGSIFAGARVPSIRSRWQIWPPEDTRSGLLTTCLDVYQLPFLPEKQSLAEAMGMAYWDRNQTWQIRAVRGADADPKSQPTDILLWHMPISEFTTPMEALRDAGFEPVIDPEWMGLRLVSLDGEDVTNTILEVPGE